MSGPIRVCRSTLIQAAKMSGVARSRHQLATLLNEAYQNREALEERIAEGRRNRKEAGNKYGMACAFMPKLTFDHVLSKVSKV